MQKLIRGTLIIAFTFGCLSGFAQEIWTLEKCIQHAHENNLQIKQQVLQADLSKVNTTSAKGSMLPTLSAFGNNTYNWGQRIDPFTNQFANTRVRSNNFFLNSNLTLFSGLQRYNSVKQSEMDYQAANYDVDKSRNDIALLVATQYLQVLFNEELLTIAEKQVQITKLQVERTQQMVDAGSVPKGNLYDIQAQFANEEVNVVQAENNLALSMLSLKQTLQLDIDTEIAISRPNINLSEPSIASRPGQIYDQALRAMPEVKSAEYGLASSEKGVAIAKGAFSPTLALNASYGTGFSGLASEVVSVTPGAPSTIGFVEGTNQSVLAPNTIFNTQVKSFGDQVQDNLNRTVGISLSIPILNGLTTQTSVSRAKISREIAVTQLESTKNALRQDIEQAYADAQAALKQYRATEKSVNALQEAFKYAQKRYDVGMLNAVDYNNSKTELARAESNLVQAKYDFVFKSKVLDFYQGKPLGF